MTRYAIGIDTGGTYTDAVVIDAREQRILAKAKALTTKGDLAVGVAEALDRALAACAARGGPSGRDIGLVSLSTTLATNAIVEGHGSPIATILVGFDDAMAARTEIASALPGTRVLRAAGGHDHAGTEQAPLDEAAIRAFIAGTEDVGAFAVAAQWSVRNPAHEHRVRALVEEIAGRPASLSSDLAHALDAPRRALTAALNARIVGRIAALIAAVRRAMAEHDVSAPLMIVKGDGTLAAADVVALRPIETILSGPAASVIGARFLSGLSDFVVSDIGGTTTDVAVLEKGWPRLDRTGALVGGRRTLVRAIDMRTYGLGGDSEVLVDPQGKVGLGTGRIVPLSLLAAVHPEALNILRRQLDDPEGEPAAGRFVLRPFGGQDSGPMPADLAPRELALLERVGSKAHPYAEVVHGPTQQRVLQRLVAQGRLALSGMTPSDAAHVLGLQSQWNAEAARIGALVTERRLRMAPFRTGEAVDAAARAFAREVFDAVVLSTGRILLDTLAGEPMDGARSLVDAVAGGSGKHGMLKVALTPTVPVVAVGGPAPVFYPEVGRRLGAETVVLEDGDVANAVGAAVGVVKVQAVVDVTSPGVGTWIIHAEGDPIVVIDHAEVLATARGLALSQARQRAEAGGAGSDLQVDVHIDRVDIPGMDGDRGLIAATIVAECWATPRD
jgi:N-methylhydantoinase A/oxoprolinase/acetone carboxylase beta subunit